VIDSLSAGKITTGTLAVGTTIRVASAGTAETEIGQGAIRILRPNTDGEFSPAIQMGGAERDVIQIVDVDTGATLAGFTEEGGAVARDVAADTLTVGGSPLGDPYDPDDAMWNFSRGAVGYRMPFLALADSPTAGGERLGVMEASMNVQGGRHYRVEFVGTMNLPDAGLPTSYVYLLDTLDGSAPTVTSHILSLASINWPSGNAGQSQQVIQSAYFTPGDDPNVWYTYRVLVAVYRRRTTGTGNVRVLSTATSPTFLTIEDKGPVGLAFMADGQMSGGGGTSAGGTAPPPAPTPTDPKRTVTKTYAATWGRTWRESGSVRTDIGPNLYQGNYSSLNFSQIGFPRDMPNDLAGSTVSKVEVYLYAYDWYYQTGTAVIGVHGNATLPSSFTYSGLLTVGDWRRGEGKWVTLPSTWYPAFASGVNKGITLGGGASSSSTYYGKFRGYTDNANPKLRVTYTK